MPGSERERLARLRANLEKRALILRLTRQFFDERSFLEVDTPIRSPAIAPEKEIVPFDSEGWFLATSPELYMKRLLAAGCPRLYQITHCFRKGERGRLHNPEFTLLEWYRAGSDYSAVIEDTEELVLFICGKLGMGSSIKYQGRDIGLDRPWGRITIQDLYQQMARWDPVTDPDPARFDDVMATDVIPHLNPFRPMVMMEYPAAMASLARLKPGDPHVAERAEVFIGTMELANCYSELTDPVEQEARFRQEIEAIQRAQKRTAPMPGRFIAAVGDMPPCAGIALGMDRLVMLFCDAASIDEVVPFTVETA
jgi:lysyl-tRNA synthetase class 2